MQRNSVELLDHGVTTSSNVAHGSRPLFTSWMRIRAKRTLRARGNRANYDRSNPRLVNSELRGRGSKNVATRHRSFGFTARAVVLTGVLAAREVEDLDDVVHALHLLGV